MVLRDGDEVLVLRVPSAAACCVQALGDGQTLQAAVQTATASADPAPDTEPWAMADTLALLIRHNAIVGWQPGSAPA